MKFNFTVLFFAMFFFANVLQAQTEIKIPTTGNTQVTVCNQLIYDMGGSTQGLTTAGDGSLTIYPSTPGTMVALSIASMIIDGYSDYFYVYNGENTSAPLIKGLQGAYTGENAAAAGEFYGNNAKGALTIRLKVTFANTFYDGLILRARCTPTVQVNNMVQNRKRVINSCNTAIYDNGGSAGNYLNNSSDTILILPDAPNKVVQLSFDYVAINNDYGLDQLFFLGGLATPGGGTLFAISGYSTNNALGTTRSADGSASFVFQSDAAYTGQGFRTLVTCSTKTATSLAETIVPITSTSAITTCSAKISDNGDKYNYFPNSNGSLTITPATAGTKAKVSFSEFNLGTGDYIKFYDGPTTASPLLTKYTSDSTANPVNATNLAGILTIQFVSDASDEGTGFVCTASCMTPIPPTSLVITPATASVDPGAKIQLSGQFLPANTTNKNIVWSTADPNIAAVNATTGVVTGWKDGASVVITGTSQENPSIKATMTINVNPYLVTSITVTPKPAKVQIGFTANLSANVQPNYATNRTVTWTSSDTTIAKVSTTGKVTGIALGTVTITATNSDGTITGTTPLTVIPISVTSILVSPATANIPGNGTVQLSVAVTPTTAADQTVTWTSADPTIATVSTTGLVTAVAVGVVNITAKSTDGGFTSFSKVTVQPTAVTGIAVAEATAQIYVSSTIQLHAALQPIYSTNTQISWTSADPTIATVDASGLVTGIATGTVVITATSVDGNFTDISTVTVLPIPVTAVSVLETTAQVEVSSTVQLHASVLPANAANQQINWSTADASIATVDASGLVTGIAPGNVVITATSVDGNFTNISSVTVLPIAVYGISITEASVQTVVNTSVQLHASIQPANAGNQQIIWTSSDPSVATVNASGLVTGVSNGSAVIKATSADGSFAATTSVAIITITGIADGLSNEGVKIYPNPCEGNFRVSFPVKIDSVEVTNVLGEKEYFTSIDDIHTTLKGVLVVKISTEKGAYFSKLIVR